MYNFEHVNVKLCIVISPLIKDDKCKCNCFIKNSYTYIFTHHIKQNTQMHNHITQWHMHYFILFSSFKIIVMEMELVEQRKGNKNGKGERGKW